MNPGKGALVRAIVYGVAILYLFVDLLWLGGPVQKLMLERRGDGRIKTEQREAQGVVAEVYAQPILLTQVDYEVSRNYFLRGLDPQSLEGEELVFERSAALGRLVDDHLLRIKVRHNLSEAKVDEVIVAEEVRSFRKRFASELELERALKAQGWGENELVLRMRAKLEQEKYLAQQVVVGVSDEEANDYYESNRNFFIRPTRLEVRHLFYASLGRGEGEAKVAAEKALAKLKAGASFSALAKESDDSRTKYDGGELGWLEEERIGPFDGEFWKKLLKCPLKQPAMVSGQIGFHVVEVQQREESRELVFEEVKEELKNSLENVQREKGSKAYFKALRVRAGKNVEVFSERLDLPWSL